MILEVIESLIRSLKEKIHFLDMYIFCLKSSLLKLFMNIYQYHDMIIIFQKLKYDLNVH